MRDSLDKGLVPVLHVYECHWAGAKSTALHDLSTRVHVNHLAGSTAPVKVCSVTLCEKVVKDLTVDIHCDHLREYVCKLNLDIDREISRNVLRLFWRPTSPELTRSGCDVG